MKTATPQSLQEAIEYFADPQRAHDFMVNVRWPNGVVCPRCGCDKLRQISTRRMWECTRCTEKKQFSVKVGTIFEDSPLPLSKWLAAIWLIGNAKNGISSCELAKHLHITQKSAWFMLHRIRVAMRTGTFEKLSGVVEADETFVGGKARFMHAAQRKAKISGRGPTGKAIVMGLLERGGQVRASVVPDRRRYALHNRIRQYVAAGSQVFTDALPSYDKLSPEYVHEAIDHAKEYVRGNVHTQNLDNFWCHLKRTIKGTYVHVNAKHLSFENVPLPMPLDTKKVETPLLLIFTPTSWLIPRPTYVDFRKLFDSYFKYETGFIILGNEFFKIAGRFPIAFTIWSYQRNANGNKNKVVLRDLTHLQDDNLKINWNQGVGNLETALKGIIRGAKNVCLDNSRGEIRDTLPEFRDTTGALVRQTRFNIYRNRTKEEAGLKIISGFPLNDPRHTSLKVPYGYWWKNLGILIRLATG
jgi:transposase-like protein